MPQDPTKGLPKDYVPCYDPGNLALLGTGRAEVDSAEVVHAKVGSAHEAQRVWASSSFAQRRKLLRCIQRYILDHQSDICAVAARDSGKPLVDAAFGEVMVTLEKIDWLCNHGEAALKPESRVSLPKASAHCRMRSAALRCTRGWVVWFGTASFRTRSIACFET